MAGVESDKMSTEEFQERVEKICVSAQVGLEEASPIAFSILVAFQWFNALNARSDQQSFFKLALFPNHWLVAGIGLVIILQLGIIYLPFR